ncbi:hypothetical protein JK358_03415 [Nocardia sp. 2]|uniref:Uncharacterized protein n=1 Tax=Nocardia acididurans TaxID=2802282 RepID=A0ABS1LZR6_9NOCA|nr:hypothetical protein [Nocardia acididurans]MBL1073435.1 hypothetical protein [Nocardia acididurans]
MHSVPTAEQPVTAMQARTREQRIEIASRRERRRAARELDQLLADDFGDGRVYAPGEYYPAAATRMLADIDAETVALERIRNFAAGVAWAIDRGDSLADVRARIERAAAVVLGCALVPVERRDIA